MILAIYLGSAWPFYCKSAVGTILSQGTPMYGMALLATCAAGFLARMKRNVKVACHEAMHGIKFSYSIQKDCWKMLAGPSCGSGI